MKLIIDERTGWEYELKGDYYYPTGRVQKNGVITPGEPPENNQPEEEKPVGIWGSAAFAFPPAIQEIVVSRFVHVRKAEYLPCRSRQSGRGFFPSAGKRNGRTGRRDRNAQSRKPDGLGAADEQHPGTGDGNREPGFDLQLTCNNT